MGQELFETLAIIDKIWVHKLTECLVEKNF